MRAALREHNSRIVSFTAVEWRRSRSRYHRQMSNEQPRALPRDLGTRMQGFAALAVGIYAYVLFLLLCAPDVHAILSA